ncbi:TIGR03086 family protein [Nesterenkonia xinjiangensis]|uniref:Uncharacterized protein (TIGR03086 family) n=1 Tax=Nesterenkonia xinjiangensis TaxID=225327 RepID=A0A7Z0KBZ6_9MICC|nr:TIGR03086 family protein [Nesterenkonia xinjiangensis]NYJ78127.1 uncharacterized protein (TIGR03086 family) [Nesterenkonia xinjiangensis]
MSIPTDPAARHRKIAEDFTQVSVTVTDWDAATPVPEWRTRDIPRHLVEWSAEFLRTGGVMLTQGASPLHDPHGAWLHHRDEVQHLLDAEDAGRDFTHPELGTLPLREAVDRFYTSDVLMHTWDLATALGRPSGLDEEECRRLLDGMARTEDALRASGHFGHAVPVGPEASEEDQLMAFIGRDPAWRP